MRVGVYVGEFQPDVGGGFTFVANIIQEFLRVAQCSKHQFTIFAPSSYARQLKSEIKSEAIGICGVRSAGRLDKALTAARHYSPLFRLFIQGKGRLERRMRERGIQFVWFVGGGAYDALDIPYLATVWDLQHRTHPWFPEVSSSGRWDYREVTQSRFLRRASHIITGTVIGREQLGWYYQVPADRISILPHPAQTSTVIGRTSAPTSLAIERLIDQPFLLYPAQFWAHKNHVHLILALKILREKFGKELHLVLTGSDKGNAKHIKNYAEKLGLTGKVHMLGFVPSIELAWLYINARALVYVSSSGPENLPPLEAFAHGCPVINSDFPGAREQLGDAALYVNPYDPDSIAIGVNTLLDDQELRAELIKRGDHRARSWTTADYVTKVFSILDSFEPVRRSWE
jgi:glycosyltransferase involved in cell wall biosynthesis